MRHASWVVHGGVGRHARSCGRFDHRAATHTVRTINDSHQPVRYSRSTHAPGASWSEERTAVTEMISPAQHVEAGDTLRKESWLTTPLTGWQCVLGWFVATGVFVAVVLIAGGPAVGDAYESIYATWGIQHLQLVCMYPPHPISITTYAAPGYPIISGIIDALLRVGHGAPYPTGTALGHGCSKAVVAMVHWSKAGGAIVPTLRTAYVSWVFLLVGLIWLVRAGGRGRSGWEPLTLLLVACLPPVWLSIEMYFHPQDIVAIGFALAATAFALRNHWIGAGVLIGCAVLTQQYTLLVAIPLLVVAPSRTGGPMRGCCGHRDHPRRAHPAGFGQGSSPLRLLRIGGCHRRGRNGGMGAPSPWTSAVVPVSHHTPRALLCRVVVRSPARGGIGQGAGRPDRVVGRVIEPATHLRTERLRLLLPGTDDHAAVARRVPWSNPRGVGGVGGHGDARVDRTVHLSCGASHGTRTCVDGSRSS